MTKRHTRHMATTGRKKDTIDRTRQEVDLRFVYRYWSLSWGLLHSTPLWFRVAGDVLGRAVKSNLFCTGTTQEKEGEGHCRILPSTHPLTLASPYPLTLALTPLPLNPYPLPLPLPLPLPVTRYPLPVTRYPLPVTRYPLPVTRYPLPVTRYPNPKP